MLQWGAVAAPEWTPIRGKFAAFGGTVRYGFVLFAGAGAASTQIELKTADELGPATYGSTGLRMVVTGGAGFRVQLGERFTVRLEVQDLIHWGSVTRINGCNSAELQTLEDQHTAGQVTGAGVSGQCNVDRFRGTTGQLRPEQRHRHRPGEGERGRHRHTQRGGRVLRHRGAAVRPAPPGARAARLRPGRATAGPVRGRPGPGGNTVGGALSGPGAPGRAPRRRVARAAAHRRCAFPGPRRRRPSRRCSERRSGSTSSSWSRPSSLAHPDAQPAAPRSAGARAAAPWARGPAHRSARRRRGAPPADPPGVAARPARPVRAGHRALRPAASGRRPDAGGARRAAGGARVRWWRA